MLLSCVCSVIDHKRSENVVRKKKKKKKEKEKAYETQPSVSLMFVPHIDILCDLSLNRVAATWNLLVDRNKRHGKF